MIRLELTDEQFRTLLIKCSKHPTVEDLFAVNEVMYGVVEAKLQKMVERDLYTTYKTAKTEAEREEARRRYLDERGIPTDFRW